MKARLSIAIVLIGASSVARADIPPGPPPSDTCSMAHAAESGGVDCVECDADPSSCQEQYAATRFFACTRAVGAVRTEIWCENRVNVWAGTADDSALTPFERGERIGRAAGVLCCFCSLLTVCVFGAAGLFFALRKKK